MAFRSKFGGVLGFAAAGCMRLFGKRDGDSGETQKKLDFPGSSHRMGLRFTDKIRDRFRAGWLRIKK